MRKYSIILLLVAQSMCAPLHAQVLSTDSLALVALYNETNGTEWNTKTNWLTGPVSSWYGITRTGNRVTSVTLPNNKLVGSLNASIGTLTELTQLSLQGNSLTGPIPNEIGALTKLKFLYLWTNQFSGSIPTTIGSLVSLENLQLYSNPQITGTIPSAIGNLTALKYLKLASNNLTGSIPPTIGNLQNLEFLYLDNNQLTGTIPVELGSLAKLKHLYVHANKLTGEIPSTLGNLPLLQRLDINRNELTGSIPSAITNLSSLIYLDLQDNALTGTIPDQIGNLTSLTDLYLGNEGTGVKKNKFKGAVPSSIGNLSSLVNLKVKDDSLSGAIPAAFINLVNLKTIDLSYNAFNLLPDLSGLSSITSLDIRNNYFTFQDIYKNRTIPGFLYDPQKSNQLADSVTTKASVGSTYMITLQDTPNNNYVWSRNGVPLDPPVNSPILQIQPLNRSNMGKYTCVITNTTVPLTFFYTHTVNATANISGTLLTELNQPPQSGKVELYEITLGAYKKVDEQNVNGLGEYTFSNAVLLDYLVKGIAVSSNPNLIPTWWTRSIYWETADVLSLVDNTKGINIQSEVKPPPPTAGEGIISGTFYEVTPDAGKVMVKSRVYGAAVTVRRIQQSGRGAEEILTLVDYKFTDENGEFEFSQLSEDDYRLNIQYPGYPMDETSYITIPVGNTLFDRHIFVEAEVISGKIFVRKLIITGWEDNRHTFEAYPNPALEFLQVFGKQSHDVYFLLTDSEAKQQPINAQWNGENRKWMIDVRQLKPGAYILHIEQNGKVEKLRILIQ